MSNPLLSICIPTYNRAECLTACLDSLNHISAARRQDVEVIISDNASTDDTKDVVALYQGRLPIRYFRNTTNIGGDRNILAAANRASGEYLWIFGDDDLFEETTVNDSLRYIDLGYDLILYNFSKWSKNLVTLLSAKALPWTDQRSYDNPNEVLSNFGSHLGYVSSIVMRKQIFFSMPSDEYERYISYGFSHLYSIYCGMLGGCRFLYVPTPAFRRRENDDTGFDVGVNGLSGQAHWNKCFIEGTALIFEDLGRRGYAGGAVLRAKDQVLKDFVIGRILAGMPGINRFGLLRFMHEHYRKNRLFWVFCVPGLILPRFILRLVRTGYHSARRLLR